MKQTLLHLHHHISRHIQDHHKKYLFGIFGGFAVVKLFLLVLGLSVVEYSYNSTFAQLATGCTLTGQYYTWEYQEWGYLTGQELTWGSLIDCIAVPASLTWGFLDEFGVLTWQESIPESVTWCILSGQTLTGWYMTWYILTWWYRTWWYVTWCAEVVNTWTTQTWVIVTWVNETWIVVSWSNGICESWDIVWNPSISWSVVRNIFPLTWSYSWTDCLSGLSLQLWDHNSQWINLGVVPVWVTSYTFDSRSLYSFQQSWLYHIIGTGTSGQYYLYTGMYTWIYSRLFSWYTLRFITADQTSVTESAPFTIDNEVPVISWITLFASWASSWYLTVASPLSVQFTASELLSGVQVILWSDILPTSWSISWLLYTYIRNFTSLTPEGVLNLALSFADLAGNTGAVFSSWVFILDTTRPVVSGFVFSGYSGWIALNFSWSEAIRYTFSYWTTWSNLLSGSTINYLTAQQLLFSWLARNQLYPFSLDVFDRAGNTRSITGDFLQTTLWTILSHIYFVPVTSTALTTTGVVNTWTLANLAVVLKAEVGKFNSCKDALTYTPIELNVGNNIFTIQMPVFKKSQMKTLVNAFTLFVLDKVKNNPDISSGDIAQITNKFDSFLVILKLLRDDDNTCKQNLSNYHISQFRQTLEEFKLNLE